MDINTNEINKEPGGGAVDLKPYTYDISEDQKNILGVGDSVVWVLGHGINWQSSKNVFKTVAVFSPDGKYVVSADEDSGVFVFQTKTGKKMFMVDDLVLGRWNPNISDSSKAFDKSVIIAPEPDDFGPNYAANRGVLSIKFIDATHYLTFIHRSDDSTPYAILYNVTDPRALKYFSLGQHPYPALNYYERDQAIDTSPSAHILVIAKESGEGILVYKYDPQKQTLTKVWECLSNKLYSDMFCQHSECWIAFSVSGRTQLFPAKIFPTRRNGYAAMSHFCSVSNHFFNHCWVIFDKLRF